MVACPHTTAALCRAHRPRSPSGYNTVTRASRWQHAAILSLVQRWAGGAAPSSIADDGTLAQLTAATARAGARTPPSPASHDTCNLVRRWSWCRWHCWRWCWHRSWAWCRIASALTKRRTLPAIADCVLNDYRARRLFTAAACSRALRPCCPAIIHTMLRTRSSVAVALLAAT